MTLAANVGRRGQIVRRNGRDRAREDDAAAPRDPRVRAYAQARRHSLRVRLFRRAIPVGAAVAIGVVLVIAVFDPFRRIGGLTLGPISLSGTKITMENPRLTGYRRDLRPYEVTATAALQDVRKPTVIELKEMKAKLAMDDNGNMAHLVAATGVFDTQKEQLELRQDVRVTTDTGHEARLASAFVDFKAGTVVSRDPVAVALTSGTVDADQLEISDNGKIIAFIGRVHAVLDSPKDGAKEAPKRDAPGHAAGREAPSVAPQKGGAATGQTLPAEPTSLRP
jgi:lipopolysaccharide export system protein LptC